MELLLLLIYSLQVIPVNETAPCFLNYTAGLDMLENCGYGDDYLESALLPFEWVTGGNFSLILVGVLTMITYIKYHTAVYPMIIGIMFLPISYFVFPDVFVSFAAILMVFAIIVGIYYGFIRQTKEF